MLAILRDSPLRKKEKEDDDNDKAFRVQNKTYHLADQVQPLLGSLLPLKGSSTLPQPWSRLCLPEMSVCE